MATVRVVVSGAPAKRELKSVYTGVNAPELGTDRGLANDLWHADLGASHETRDHSTDTPAYGASV